MTFRHSCLWRHASFRFAGTSGTLASRHKSQPLLAYQLPSIGHSNIKFFSREMQPEFQKLAGPCHTHDPPAGEQLVPTSRVASSSSGTGVHAYQEQGPGASLITTHTRKLVRSGRRPCQINSGGLCHLWTKMAMFYEFG